jgi:RND family efflux transporter MFP subunit
MMLFFDKRWSQRLAPITTQWAYPIMLRFFGKRWVWGTALGFATFGTLLIFRQAHHAMEMADPGRARTHGRPIPVRTAPVTDAECEQVIGATAVTAASCEAVVRAMSPSRGTNTTDIIVSAVHVREGDPVHRGQLLFEVVDEVRMQSVRRAEVALAAERATMERVKKALSFAERAREMEMASADANLKFRKEDLESRERAFEAMRQLQKERAVSVLEYFEVRSKFSQAQFELSEAERRVKRAKDMLAVGLLQDKEDLAKATRDLESARLELEDARRDVRWCQVTSPIDGIIDNKIDIAPGQVLAVVSSLARVISLSPIHVRVDFPQERMDEVAVGQQAEIVLDSFPKETFLGKVIRVSPLVNPQLRVFPVVVELPNPDLRIKAGVSGFVRLCVHRKATAVPATAVIQHGSKAMVFRVDEGRARLQEVRIGHLLEPGILEVRGGLAAGDEVVVYFSNFYRHWRELASKDCYLQDGDRVDVDWRRWARRE